MGRNWLALPATTVVSLSLLLTACGEAPVPPEDAPAALVSVLKTSASSVVLSDDLQGRVVAFRTAEIRPQVGGIVEKVAFEQGSEVAAGKLLFQINPAPFRAEVNSAMATLKRAEAVLTNARVQVQRLKPLSQSEAVSRQTYDNAVAAELQAQADVAQAKAALERRQLDLRYAAVASPISGRIGVANVTEGALVSVGDAKAMATVQQIDQVYIDVRQPMARIEALRAAAGQNAATAGAEVEIFSSSGDVLPSRGRLLFSDISIDPETGDGVVRVIVPNKSRALLPGMFVRARLPRISQDAAVRIPQQAVIRDGQGQAQVYVVDTKKNAKLRAVKLSDVVNGEYVVLEGLVAGETVAVEGMDRIMPETPINPVPWQPTKPGN